MVSRAKEPCPDGCLGDSKGLRHVTAGETFHVPQEEHLPQAVGQGVQRALRQPLPFPGDRELLWSGCAVPHGGFRRAVKRHNGAGPAQLPASPTGAQMVQGIV
jgi:hypothetical protein